MGAIRQQCGHANAEKWRLNCQTSPPPDGVPLRREVTAYEVCAAGEEALGASFIDER